MDGRGEVMNAAPEFVDPASSKAWLDNVPLANVAAAQRDLLSQVEEFNRFPTGAANRLAVLETLREAVNFVQVEQAKRFQSCQMLAQAAGRAVINAVEQFSNDDRAKVDTARPSSG